jgi:hypothetical protein
MVNYSTVTACLSNTNYSALIQYRKSEEGKREGRNEQGEK